MVSADRFAIGSAQAEVFAVTGGVLADEGDLPDAAGDEGFGFGDDGLEAAGAELAAELGDDAEAAGMVAALGDLDVGRGARRGQDARCGVRVEVLRQGCGSAIPRGAGEASLLLAQVAFRAGGKLRRVFRGAVGEAVLMHRGVMAIDGRIGGGCAAGQDGEGGVGVRGEGGSGEAGGFEDGFEFSGADDGVHLRNVFADLIAVPLHQAAGDDEACGLAALFALVLDHLEDGVDGLLLGGVDEAAGVDDDDVGVFGVGGEFAAGAVEQAHHDFGVDEVFGAAERDEADAWASLRLRGSGVLRGCAGGEREIKHGGRHTPF